MIQADIRTLGSLRRQWFVVALLYGAALVLGYQILSGSAHVAHVVRWMALAATTMLVQLAILWRTLPFNHRRGEPQLFPALGLANGLTLARGALTCLLAGFLFSPAPAGQLAWAPAALYAAERLLDLVDGWAARRSRRETELGSILDIEFDGLGLLIAVALGVGYGLLPGWYLLLGVSRPLFVLGMALRRRRGLAVADLPPSDHRRVIAGLQTGFVAVLLWPVWSSEVTRLAGTIFAVPLVASFGRDWLVVSGAIDAGSARYAAARRQAKRLLEGWLPLLLRLAVVLPALAVLARFGGSGRMAAAGFGIVGMAALVLLALGVLGRAAALVLLIVAALDAAAIGVRWSDNALVFAAAAALLHLGSGFFALWKPEERLIRVKLGGSRDTD